VHLDQISFWPSAQPSSKRATLRILNFRPHGHLLPLLSIPATTQFPEKNSLRSRSHGRPRLGTPRDGPTRPVSAFSVAPTTDASNVSPRTIDADASFSFLEVDIPKDGDHHWTRLCLILMEWLVRYRVIILEVDRTNRSWHSASHSTVHRIHARRLLKLNQGEQQPQHDGYTWTSRD